MDIKEKVSVGVLTLIIASLSFVGGVNLNDDNIYYCADRQLVMPCDSFSAYYGLENGKCINAEIGNKVCRTGWIKIEKELNLQKTIYQELCHVNGSCTPIGG